MSSVLYASIGNLNSASLLKQVQLIIPIISDQSGLNPTFLVEMYVELLQVT